MAFNVNNNLCKAGGIIAYTKKNNKIYLLMINNTKKEKLTHKYVSYYEDPGGKFEKSDNGLIYGMCREFEEETSLLYYQNVNNKIKINISTISDTINKATNEMKDKIEKKIDLIFLPKSKYALGFLEVNPDFMNHKLNKYETLTEKEKKEKRSLEWIKSEKILYKKLHPRLFYNKEIIINFLKLQNLLIRGKTKIKY